ncbi:hypothetical protein C8R45DRAFT_1010312 [Mycena sanguinolenta]|nr:hypothetical protein C8R45DRAFT_1010312 [Mycena sanguinolenta]
MSESLGDTEIQQQFEISRYVVLIPFTILAYEYILTFRLEVERYWGTGFTWPTVLFYVNRYSTLFGTVPILAEMLLTTTDPRKRAMCDAFKNYHQYFVLLSQILIGVMLIMRTYALYERNNYVLAVMILVSLSAIAFGLYILLSGGQPDTLDPHLQTFGCPTPSHQDANIRSAAGWGGMLVFDVMIFTLTVYKALRYETRSGSLFSVMFRDGSIYFGIMIATNAANIATYTSGGPIISGAGTTFMNAISAVLISRLMLNLRDPQIHRFAHRNRTTRFTTTRDSPAITTLMHPYPGTDIEMDSVWIGQSEEEST